LSDESKGGVQPVDKKDRQAKPERHYPPMYERMVPIALGIIVVAILILLFIIVRVALG
jgi:hypothetical protein